MGSEFIKKYYGYLKLLGLILSFICMILYAVAPVHNQNTGLLPIVLGRYNRIFPAGFIAFAFATGVFSSLFFIMDYGIAGKEETTPITEIVNGFLLAVLHWICAGILIPLAGKSRQRNIRGTWFDFDNFLVATGLIKFVDGMGSKFLRQPYGFLKLLGMVLSFISLLLFTVPYADNVQGLGTPSDVAFGLPFVGRISPWVFGAAIFSCLFFLIEYGVEEEEDAMLITEIVFGCMFALLHILASALIFCCLVHVSGESSLFGIVIITGVFSIIAACIYLADGIFAIKRKNQYKEIS